MVSVLDSISDTGADDSFSSELSSTDTAAAGTETPPSQQPAPPATPKRGRPKKSTTPKLTPAKRGRKPKAPAVGEDGEPLPKKPRGRPSKAAMTAADAAAVPGTTPTKPVAAAAAAAAGGVKQSGLSSAMTKGECEYILNSLIEGANWTVMVRSTNEKYGQNRQAGNVKSHWRGPLMKTLLAMYKDDEPKQV